MPSLTPIDFKISFINSGNKAFDAPPNYLIFDRSEKSDDIDSISFDLNIPEGVDFDFNGQIKKLLEGNVSHLALPEHYDKVQLVFMDGEICFTATKGAKPLVVGIGTFHSNCGIDTSDDPGCRFLKQGASCDLTQHSISWASTSIIGEIMADLYVSKKNRNMFNRLVVTVTPYRDGHQVVIDPAKVPLVLQSTSITSDRGKKDDKHAFSGTLKFKHDKQKDICYFIQIKWHDINNTRNRVPYGRIGKGYTNNLKFSIGDLKQLPNGFRLLRDDDRGNISKALRSHIMWKDPISI